MNQLHGKPGKSQSFLSLSLSISRRIARVHWIFGFLKMCHAQQNQIHLNLLAKCIACIFGFSYFESRAKIRQYSLVRT